MKYIFKLIVFCLLLSSCKQEKEAKPIATDETTVVPVTQRKEWAITLQAQIDSVTYATEYKQANAKATVYRSVTDSLLANRMLKGIVTFGNYRGGRLTASDSGAVVMEVRPKSGIPVTIEKGRDMYFKAYYPGLHLLVCGRAGYDAIESFNLLTGATGREAGSPWAIFPSVDGAVRVNGFKSGEGCTDYFIEKWNGSTYIKVRNSFADIHREGQFPCNINDAFWKDHYTLYFRRNGEKNDTYYILRFSAI